MTNTDHNVNIEHRSCSLPVTTSNYPPAQQIIIDCIHTRADEIRRRELETAFSRLEARGEFTDEQHAIVEELTDVLVAKLLESPTIYLRDECVTRSELQTAADLFLSSPSDEQQ